MTTAALAWASLAEQAAAIERLHLMVPFKDRHLVEIDLQALSAVPR